jgi:hypothetical protein
LFCFYRIFQEPSDGGESDVFTGQSRPSKMSGHPIYIYNFIFSAASRRVERDRTVTSLADFSFNLILILFLYIRIAVGARLHIGRRPFLEVSFSFSVFPLRFLFLCFSDGGINYSRTFFDSRRMEKTYNASSFSRPMVSLNRASHMKNVCIFH